MFPSLGYLSILGVKPRFWVLRVHSLPAELPGKLPVDSLKCWEFLRIPQVYIFTFLSKVICFQILFWSKIHNEYFSIFFFPPLLCSCFAWLSSYFPSWEDNPTSLCSLPKCFQTVWSYICLQRCKISTLSSCTLSMPIGSGKRSNLVSIKEIWDVWWSFGRRKSR